MYRITIQLRKFEFLYDDENYNVNILNVELINFFCLDESIFIDFYAKRKYYNSNIYNYITHNHINVDTTLSTYSNIYIRLWDL